MFHDCLFHVNELQALVGNTNCHCKVVLCFDRKPNYHGFFLELVQESLNLDIPWVCFFP